jgi:hypothetical protein
MASTDPMLEGARISAHAFRTGCQRLFLACRRSLLMVIFGFIAFTVYLSFTDSCACCRRSIRLAGRISGNVCLGSRLGHRRHKPCDLRVPLHHHLHDHRPDAGDLAGPKDTGQAFLRPIFSTQLSFIVTGTAWKWIPGPCNRAEIHALVGWETLVNWIKERRYGDLYHRHCSGLA